MRPRGSRGPSNGAAFDKASPEYWRAIETGDFVSLSDAEAFAAGMAAGFATGVDYTVGEIRVFELRGPGEAAIGAGLGAARSGQTPLGTYRFIELQSEGSGPLYLAVVESEGSLELRLYYIPLGLESGTRDELIDRGETWLFLPPANPEDFISSELEYAPYPDVPPVDGHKLVFSRAGPGPLYAEALDTGAPTILAEYEAEDQKGIEVANPLLLVLEEGWMKADGTEPQEGGCVTFMMGCHVDPAEVDHMPRPR